MLKQLGTLAQATLLAIVLTAGLPAGAFAQTVSSNPTANTVTLSDNTLIAGEVVTPVNERLTSYTFQLRRVTPTASVVPEVYEWNGSAVVGGPIWSGSAIAVENTVYEPFTFSPGIAVDQTKQYLLAVRQGNAGNTAYLLAGYVDNHPGYAAGYRLSPGPGWLLTPTAELNFSALFEPTPAIPTMTEWAMILLGLMLAGGATVIIQRRRTVV